MRAKRTGNFIRERRSSTVAAPAEYLVTGVNTFIVSHDGIVYEKDLGENTLEEFRKMERYNPDSTWRAVPDS